MTYGQPVDRRIFVTGAGFVSPSPEAERVARPDGEQTQALPVRRVADVGAGDLIDQATLRRMDRFSQMSMVAAERAVRSANLTIQPGTAERMGIVFNSCFGPLQSTEQYVDKILKEGPKRAPAGLFPFTALNVFTGLITMRLKLLGTNSTLCGSSSMTYAVNALRQGTDDALLVGGVESLTDSMVTAFGDEAATTCQAETENAWSGAIALSEGAAVVVLEGETAEGEAPEGAIAQVHQFGTACSLSGKGSFGIVPRTIEHAMQEALACSNITPEQIDVLVFAGNSFNQLNLTELSVARTMFAEGGLPPAVNPKYSFGETLGAAEVFGVSTAADILRHQELPEAMVVEEQEWKVTRMPSSFNYALVNSIEFGGAVTSYVMSSVPSDRKEQQ